MAEIIMTKQRILMLKAQLQRAMVNKFTKNFSICSFYLMCPKNGQPMQITYNSHIVGNIDKGKMTVLPFNADVWKKSIYKYDLLHEIKNEFHPKKKRGGKKSSTNTK